MSRLTKISFLIALFFGLDKIVGIIRQVIIVRQFGLSANLDAFNVANNLPDLLYALISGGALAIALIPILSEVLTREGKKALWLLFSRIANLAFLVTALLAVLIAVFAPNLVGWKFGIAPGFNPEQRTIVINLIRLDLIATLIFSISGMVMASLQVNQHFLLPAMAPLLYNAGQIVGVVFFVPIWGVYGLAYGVMLGAALHLLIQVPALVRHQFTWFPSLGLKDVYVIKVLKLMGPRVISIFFIQLTFLVRDNLASRLQQGAVSALTYGWMIQQVPETLIGTAIGTALLPTLSELITTRENLRFKETIERAVNVLIAITIPIAVIGALGLRPFLEVAFKLPAEQTDLLLMVTRGYLVGLLGQSVLETIARSFYARQVSLYTMLGSFLNLVIYVTLGSYLIQVMGAVGISLTDSIAFTIQPIFLILVMNRQLKSAISIGWVPLKGMLAGVAAAAVMLIFPILVQQVHPLPALATGIINVTLGLLASLPFVWKEARLIIRL